MATNQQLADALERVRQVGSTRGAGIVRSRELTRQDRQLLVANQWLQPITRGWYLLTRPDVPFGDSGPWYSHFWEFLGCYLNERFGSDYCLSAESSLLLHTGYSLIPSQVVAIVTRGAGNPVQLPYDTSLLPYANPSKLPSETETVKGLRVMPLPLALVRLSPAFFSEQPAEVQLGLRMIQSSADLSQRIAEGGHRRAGGRLVAAYQAIGETAFAEQLESEMKTANIRFSKADNPFGKDLPEVHFSRSPYAARIEVSWALLRKGVEELFPSAPGLPQDPTHYMQHLDELYRFDAYHSLSIEGYQVSPELIDKVRNHAWNPDADPEDRQVYQALAARGYYEAFGRVKETIKHLFLGEDPAARVNQDLPEWYKALWAPQVRAGVLEPHHVIGYRRGPVFIRGSRHTPPPREALSDAMDALFKCMERERNPAVRALVGHYLFVFIHPYPDGNGRIARFLMNTMFASGGYPWTIIRVEHRQAYFGALEAAHTSGDLSLFTRFVLEEMKQTER